MIDSSVANLVALNSGMGFPFNRPIARKPDG